jgi:hypothetical protein
VSYERGGTFLDSKHTLGRRFVRRGFWLTVETLGFLQDLFKVRCTRNWHTGGVSPPGTEPPPPYMPSPKSRAVH